MQMCPELKKVRSNKNLRPPARRAPKSLEKASRSPQALEEVLKYPFGRRPWETFFADILGTSGPKDSCSSPKCHRNGNYY